MKRSKYLSRPADAAGRITYTADEDAVWADLYARQSSAIAGRACQEFLDGLCQLSLPSDRVPQLPEVSAALSRTTGWKVVQVPALIPFSRFCALLANREFPAATFVRRRDELDYLKEPDIFHEVFGHTPLLTHPWFADFTQAYGRLGLGASESACEFLARLYWFTVEFGLIRKPEGLRIYGGGILSSIRETVCALESADCLRKPFELIEVLRTPYRIDIVQPVYFVIEDLRQLHDLRQVDLLEEIARVRGMGLLPPLFDPPPADPPQRRAA